jgi:hypothetical protein
MRILLLLFVSLLSVFSMNAQEDNWTPIDGSPFFMKQEGDIMYITTSDLTKENLLTANTPNYISRNLNLLHETEFNKSIAIFFVPDRPTMHEFTGKKYLSSLSSDAQSAVMMCVYDDKYCPLNLELMKLMAIEKWGEVQDDELIWLREGLASYATPEAYGCDGYTFEERYAAFVQMGEIVNFLYFPEKEETLSYKIACNQSAYLVGYLLDHYGVDKLKRLWQGQMSDFEMIYGRKLEELVDGINKELKKTYPQTIHFNSEEFEKDCIYLDPDAWLPTYQMLYNPATGYDPAIGYKMVTREVGNLKFTLDSKLSMAERDELIKRTDECIARGLEFINESPFPDSLHLILAPTRNAMKNIMQSDQGGLFVPKQLPMPDEYNVTGENLIYAVHGGEHNALGHEIMHAVTCFKWGMSNTTSWLDEGLAVLAFPESESCDGYTFEERYVYFLQNEKLLTPENLSYSFETEYENFQIQMKIFYSRSAYWVECLIEEYGISKLKQFWQGGADAF